MHAFPQLYQWVVAICPSPHQYAPARLGHNTAPVMQHIKSTSRYWAVSAVACQCQRGEEGDASKDELMASNEVCKYQGGRITCQESRGKQGSERLVNVVEKKGGIKEKMYFWWHKCYCYHFFFYSWQHFTHLFSADWKRKITRAKCRTTDGNRVTIKCIGIILDTITVKKWYDAKFVTSGHLWRKSS